MKFQKGHKLATGRPKGSKNVKTLLEEERRARFDEKASERWEQIINDLIAKNPTYVADQFMGKSPEKLNIKAQVVPFDDIPENNSISENKEAEKAS